MIDRKTFFAEVRKAFGPLNQKQVDGFNVILHTWETRFWDRTSIPQGAVVLATSWHETARTMQPIAEIGNGAYFTRLYDVQGSNPARARRYGNTAPGDGILYRGRGYVQLTWKVNYDKATKRLRELGMIGPDVDFVEMPDLVMKADYAVLILFIGMEEGWFTGKKLDSIVDDKVDGDEFKDFVDSRKIINGTDRDVLIAGHAMKFLTALTASVKPGDNKVPVVIPPSVPIVIAPPEDKPQAYDEVAGASAWNRFWMNVAGLFSDKNA